jgi:hypothetical protein
MKLHAYTLGNVAQIYFDQVPGKSNKDSEHFGEDLHLGQCSLGFENNNIAEIFNKHNLACVREQDCSEIIAFAKLWTFPSGGDLNKRRVVALGGGEYEINVSENGRIAGLFEDLNFKKLSLKV